MVMLAEHRFVFWDVFELLTVRYHFRSSDSFIQLCTLVILLFVAYYAIRALIIIEDVRDRPLFLLNNYLLLWT